MNDDADQRGSWPWLRNQTSFWSYCCSCVFKIITEFYLCWHVHCCHLLGMDICSHWVLSMLCNQAWLQPTQASLMAETPLSQSPYTLSLVLVKDKEKKAPTFKKPQQLLHPSWKWIFWKSVILTTIALYKIGCYMDCSLMNSLFLSFKLITWSPICHTLCISPSYNVTSITMSGIEHFVQHQNNHHRFLLVLTLTLILSKLVSTVMLCYYLISQRIFSRCERSKRATDTGIASGIVAQAWGTLCFKLEDKTGGIHTIKLPGSPFIPKLLRLSYALNTGHSWMMMVVLTSKALQLYVC